MARNITVNTELTGEAAFKSAMENIGAAIRVTKSEMALANAEFEGQANTMDALTAKHDALKNLYDEQAAKVEILRQALEQTSSATGENSTETLRLTAEYNRARLALERIGGDLSEVEGYMEEAAASADGCATSIDEFGRAVEDADENAGGLGEDGPGAIDAIAQALATGEIAKKMGEIAKAFAEITSAAADYADSVNTLSAQTGISVENVQALMYSAELVDVPVETIARSMMKTTQAMSSARQGTGAAAEAFNTLGIQVTNADGSLRDNEAVFWETVDALAAIEDPTERDALALELFGRNAMQLNPLLKAGSAGMRAYKEEAEDMGYILSEQDLSKLQDLDDAQVRFSNAVEGLKNSVGTAFAPTMEQANNLATEVIGMFTSFVNEHQGFVSSFGSVATAVAGVTAAFAGLKAALKTAQVAGLITEGTFLKWSATLGAMAGPIAIVAAIMGIGITTAANYFKELEHVGEIDSTNLEELAQNVQTCQDALDDFRESAGTQDDMKYLWNDAEYRQEEQLTAALANAQRQYDAVAAAASGVGPATEVSAEEAAAAIDSTTEAAQGLIDAFNSVYNSAESAMKGTTGLFNDLTGETDMSVGEMTGTWEDQTKAISDYTDNLQTLRDLGLSEDLVLELSDGSLEDMQTAAQLVKELSGDGDGASVEDVNAAWEARKAAIADYAAYVAENSTEVQAAMDALVATAQEGAGNMDLGEQMQSAAGHTIAGYVAGLDSGPVKTAMFELASEALTAFYGALGIASPSKKMMQAARYTVEGFTIGIDDGRHDVAEAMDGLADTALDSFDTRLSGIDSQGAALGGSGGGNTTNIYVQEMTEAQTDYLVNEVNRRLG